MDYGYLRVSTGKQSLENQRFEILQYVNPRRITIDSWIEEVESGGKKASERKLGDLLKQLKKGDRVFISELSRLGRSILSVMSTLNELMEKGCKLYSIKEGFELGENISSKVLAFAFGLSAEIERQLISQRTKEALARKKAEGMKLGRKKGFILKNKKLTPFESEIENLYSHGVSARAISRLYKVHHSTVLAFIKEKNFKRR